MCHSFDIELFAEAPHVCPYVDPIEFNVFDFYLIQAIDNMHFSIKYEMMMTMCSTLSKRIHWAKKGEAKRWDFSLNNVNISKTDWLIRNSHHSGDFYIETGSNSIGTNELSLSFFCVCHMNSLFCFYAMNIRFSGFDCMLSINVAFEMYSILHRHTDHRNNISMHKQCNHDLYIYFCFSDLAKFFGLFRRCSSIAVPFQFLMSK